MYKKLYQKNIKIQSHHKVPHFLFPTGSAKQVQDPIYQHEAPNIKYFRNDANNCCYSSLEYVLSVVSDIVPQNTISKRIENSLNFCDQGLPYIIKYANKIMNYSAINKGDKCLCYTLKNGNIAVDFKSLIILVKMLCC